MRNKFVLNFWHALLLLIGIRAVYLLIYVIIGMLFKTSYKTDPFLISLEYVSILLFIPFVFWFAKKSDTNFKESFFIPDLSTVIKMIVVVVLAQTIVLSPLSHFDIFFDSLKNSKLRILGATLRPLFPLLDLRMILIVPLIEELFFRGLVLKNFLKMYSPVYAILLSSLLFGVYHLNIDTLIFHISLGIIFGILYYKSNSLILVMLAHIIWNAFSLFNYDYIEIDLTSSILHFLVYFTALISLFFLLRKKNHRETSHSRRLTNDNKDNNKVSTEHRNFISILTTIHQLLHNSGNHAQADFINNLIELINQNNYSLFIKLINSVNMWGGSGAVWEVYIDNKNEAKAFEKEMISLIDLMEKTKILGKGIKPIKKIFEKILKNKLKEVQETGR